MLFIQQDGATRYEPEYSSLEEGPVEITPQDTIHENAFTKRAIAGEIILAYKERSGTEPARLDPMYDKPNMSLGAIDPEHKKFYHGPMVAYGRDSQGSPTDVSMAGFHHIVDHLRRSYDDFVRRAFEFDEGLSGTCKTEWCDLHHSGHEKVIHFPCRGDEELFKYGSYQEIEAKHMPCALFSSHKIPIAERVGIPRLIMWERPSALLWRNRAVKVLVGDSAVRRNSGQNIRVQLSTGVIRLLRELGSVLVAREDTRALHPTRLLALGEFCQRKYREAGWDYDSTDGNMLGIKEENAASVLGVLERANETLYREFWEREFADIMAKERLKELQQQGITSVLDPNLHAKVKDTDRKNWERWRTKTLSERQEEFFDILLKDFEDDVEIPGEGTLASQAPGPNNVRNRKKREKDRARKKAAKETRAKLEDEGDAAAQIEKDKDSIVETDIDNGSVRGRHDDNRPKGAASDGALTEAADDDLSEDDEEDLFTKEYRDCYRDKV